MKKRIQHISLVLMLLLLGGAMNEAWAYKVTYHILTLPMNHDTGNTMSSVDGKRVEAIRVIVDDASTVGALPAHFKSPLAKNFKFYESSNVTNLGASAIYEARSSNKYILYTIINEASTLSESAAIPSNNYHIYVTYEYDADNKIAKLDGSEAYNIEINGRFMAFNKGRNNRIAMVPAEKVSGEQLVSNEFVKVDVSGTGITTWWNGNPTKPRDKAESYFHFLFKYEGLDPYNITIRTAYTGNDYYQEKYGSDPGNLNRYYKWASVFSTQKLTDNLLLASDDNRQYTTVNNNNMITDVDFTEDGMKGYYRGYSGRVWNSFAMLNNSSETGYVFMGSRMVADNNGKMDDPKKSGSDYQYYYLQADNNELKYALMTESKVESSYSSDKDMYDIHTFVFNVKTPFNNTIKVEKVWTDAYLSQSLADHLPDGLRRKYVSFDGFYSDQEFTNSVTTFAEAESRCSKDGDGKYQIYVKYSTASLPFTALAAGGDYANATWYELTDAGSVQADGKKIKLNSSVFKNNGAAATTSGTYEKESEFAFIGDPYELRIINRALTTTNSANWYVGSSERTDNDDLDVSNSDTGDGFKWEIPYDDISGSFVLKEFGSNNAYWNWTTGSAGNNIQYSTSASTRIKFMELGKVNYTFKVVDLAGNIAIEATDAFTPFTTLTTSYSHIPSAIRSPYIADETVSYWASYVNDRTGRKNLTTNVSNLSNQLSELPGTSITIYVTYTTLNLTNKNIKLLYSQEFNVKLNGEYIYWNSEAGDKQNKILSKALENNADELGTTPYLWHLRGRDPYAMRIDNKGASVQEFTDPSAPGTTGRFYDPIGDGTYTNGGEPEHIANGMFVRVKDGTWDGDKELEFVNNRDNASRFIAMMSDNVGVYEVLAATGDANYYHIGRASTPEAETMIYSSATYPHGADQLRFELAGTTVVTYHLLDKNKEEIFKNEITSKNPRLTLPADYVSPLVEEYYFYPTKAKALDALTANVNDPNVPRDRIAEITEDTGEGEGERDNAIYVTYKVDSGFGFGTSYPRLMKFLDPHKGGYKLEDGSDKLTKTEIEAIYPYCNGDGSLNIYGQVMRDEQMDGGANTRPRWVWYFESEHNDPYHVKIHSKSTISFAGRSSYTYLKTFAVHFNQDTEKLKRQQIVTGGNLTGITLDEATEYAILGVKKKYKLLTIDHVKADLNGDGDTSDDGENERRTVTSFEQYWKTYNMIRLDVLGLDEATEDGFSDDPSTFIVPNDKRDELKTKQPDWHSYEVVANATRWNGFNDVAGKDGLEKKKVERLEHWFQTFDMGNGTFDIEDADIPAVLVLLDRHGWEIMRKPIPVGDGDTDPQAGEKLAVLRAYDSPMVKEYKFYSNATKASNCHKFTLRMQNGAERDPIKKADGSQFTSTSLATLPPYKVDQDLFVTYTVKEEYEKSYEPSTSTASKFIILQNGKYAKDNGSTISPTAVQTGGVSAMILSPDATADSDEPQDGNIDDVNLWYVQPNSNIDTEMGYPWDPITTYTDKEKGFDPYNIQIKNASTGAFFTIGMKKSVLEGGTYTGDYTEGTLDVTLSTTTTPVNSPESYDHSTLHMTNQTFMAVQDVNGNMQLMPRFDHSRRINAFTTLAVPQTHATKASVDDADPGEQTTFMVRPLVFDYRIIDNNGNVALHYKTAGESYPSIPEHFKSPIAKDFKYYFGYAETTTDASTEEDWNNATGVFKKTLINEGQLEGQVKLLTTQGDYYFKIGNSDYTYKKVTVNKPLSEKEITSSFAAVGIKNSADIIIRYSYDKESDSDYDNILRGRWMTMSLGGNDAQYSGDLNASGSGIFTGSKDATKNEWQWKFLQSPCVSTSPYYSEPDPYAVRVSNRKANNDDPLKADSKMSISIKVDNKDRFVILSHPSGDYALCAASDELTYSFLNGGSMTEPSTTPASINLEENFTKTSNSISAGARIILNNEVTHNYRYNIITVGKILAAYQYQDDNTALSNSYIPVLPEEIQSPLINLNEYLYYGTATYTDKGTTGDSPDDEYEIDRNSQIDDLYGLYDDVVYVHYPTFSRDNTPYMVPNERNATSLVPANVAVGDGSNDVAIDINGNLPYNIIWLTDNMMTSNGTTISDGGCHNLSGETADKWHFTGNDPYAIQIKHDSGDKCVNGDGTLVASGSAKSYMLLKRENYEPYGVFAETGNQTSMLTFSGSPKTLTTVTSDPAKFIPFALSVHHLIYRLIIAKSCANHASPNAGESVNIPYRTGNEETYQTSGSWTDQVTTIYGSTQRDLSSKTTVTGDTYQLGSTIYFYDGSTTEGKTYCYDAGKVSLGDVLEVPSAFKRPNCRYYYYVQDIYDNLNEDYNASTDENTGGTDKRCETLNTTLNNKYKGLKMDDETPIFIKKSDLIGKTVVVNITYSFDAGLPTNAGDGFVTDVDQNLWYTLETNEATPFLAHYTNAWGLQAMEGRDTRYTNDYLWLPLGDPYGFKMYNRYIKKNSLTTGDDNTRMMTSTAVNVEGRKLLMGTPGASITEDEETRTLTAGYEVYELLASNTDGYFRVHPVINNSGTQFFIWKDPTDNYAKLSTTATEWRFGLSQDLIQPYIDRVGYVGGLKSEVANSTDFVENNKHLNVKELITVLKDGNATAAQLMDLQSVVYDVRNIVEFAPGYYRLHNQPGVSSINPVRYASGYLHDIEKTQEKGFFQKTAADAAEVISKSNTLRNIGDYFFNINGGNSYQKVTVTVAYDGVTYATHNADFSVSSNLSEWAAAGGMPMHFYSRAKTNTTFTGEGGLSTGFTESNATRGEIPIPATEYDPSSIFYMNGSVSTNKTISTATLSTQGLNVNQNRMTTGAAQTFTMMDLGGAVFLIHDGSAPATRMYLNFDQTSNKYDLQYYHEAPTDDAKWCLEPANNQGLKVSTNDGGDGYFYATFCAPYDVLLPDDSGSNSYAAYICTGWNENVIYPEKVAASNPHTAGKFVRAGTPVIIRTTNNTGSIELTLPSSSPTTPASDCVFTGEYLEQLLSGTIPANGKVYTFGLPITGYNIIEDGGGNDGEITNLVARDQAKTGVGFYINANPNKELGDNTGAWTPNNRYVLHNKIYYRAGSSGSSARQNTRGVEFVPVVFDDEENEPELFGIKEENRRVYDNRVYDLQGRCVATEEQVKDGTWRQNLRPGIYIINGRKIRL